jgi:hypothetical protein
MAAFIKHTWHWLWALDTRLTELLLGYLLLIRGLVWTSPLGDMSSRVYEPLTEIMGVHQWGITLSLFGFAQIIGVIINGRWHRSPFLRRGVLTFSLIIYTVLTSSFHQSTIGGAGLQATMQQLVLALCCFWCLVNVAAKKQVVT